MPARRLPPDRGIKNILQHSDPLPPEAETPLAHYKWTVEEHWSLLDYFRRKTAATPSKAAVRDYYFRMLHSLLLVQVIEAFERFLKETAAVCVDHLAEFVLDRRFAEFQIRGDVFAAHFQGGTIGKAMCESDTWLDCRDINDRFRKVLAGPFQAGDFYAFPGPTQEPAAERFRLPLVNLVWQLRHTIVHNVGVITPSDAIKFRLLSQESVVAPRLLAPEFDDVRYVRDFLDDTARAITRRVGQRLADLLSTLHLTHGLIFDLQAKADAVSRQFHQVLSIAGATGTLPEA